MSAPTATPGERVVYVDTSGLALIGRLSDVPLRSLDALHLALARQLGVERLATARMADAASAPEMEVVRFG